MISSDTKITPNWAKANTVEVLHKIHHSDTNIAIYERGVKDLESEVAALVTEQIELRAQGEVGAIMDTIRKYLNPDSYPRLMQDIENLLDSFQSVSKSETLKLFLVTTSSNMCRKFHTDINDLRLLCTYSGPGTLWLKDEDIHRLGLEHATINDAIIDERIVQQVTTGSVAILKGAIYPDVVNGVVHRSPTIEETGDQRLLLRIDTLSTQNLWK